MLLIAASVASPTVESHTSHWGQLRLERRSDCRDPKASDNETANRIIDTDTKGALAGGVSASYVNRTYTHSPTTALGGTP